MGERERGRERAGDQSKISQWILLKAQLRIYEIIKIFGVPITATVAKVALQPFDFVTLRRWLYILHQELF